MLCDCEWTLTIICIKAHCNEIIPIALCSIALAYLSWWSTGWWWKGFWFNAWIGRFAVVSFLKDAILAKQSTRHGGRTSTHYDFVRVFLFETWQFKLRLQVNNYHDFQMNKLQLIKVRNQQTTRTGAVMKKGIRNNWKIGSGMR